MEILWAFDNFNFTALLDILLVATLIFAASVLIRGTQAVSLLRGTMIVLFAIGLFSSVLQLVALRWLLGHVITAVAVAIPVIFQPELRRALTRLGGASFFGHQQIRGQIQHNIEQVCVAADRLSERRHGALIVLERTASLQEYINSGVPLYSEVTPQLLLTIFWPKTELHDGAAILTGNQIAAAACVLPLSSGHRLSDRKLGTRHRAALGISEVSDAICVVVSEETGQISVANGGRMIRRLDSNRLRTILSAFYGEDTRRSPRRFWVDWERRARNLISRLTTE
jgi:diadenylate cyclase